MTVSYGYTLSSEEHSPLDLVRNARRAEEVGFDFVSISDHYHPWVTAQGHSPFVWSVLGAHRHVNGELARRRRGDLPDRAHPPGDPRPGHRDDRAAVRRTASSSASAPAKR